ncbi:MAG TPA: hypothetical protein VG298_01555, partial [Acidimicrobiales bacterium]|nr:hypothetical protein [Acidimicrobiales bacterium]
LEVGQLALADEHLETTAQIARDLRQPAYLWNVELLRSARAILAGDLTEAERLAMSAFEIGQSALLPPSLAVGSMAGQLFVIRHDQGRLEELEPMARMVLVEQPGVPSWHMTLATILVETGHHEEGREHFELGAADHGLAVPRDAMWVTGMVLLAELSVRLGDPVRADELWHLLVPFTGRMGWGTIACAGPVDLRLGMLAGALGRAEEAARLLAASARLCEDLQSPTWLARTVLEQARLAEGEERMTLATRALAMANEVGAEGIARRVRELLGESEPNPQRMRTDKEA